MLAKSSPTWQRPRGIIVIGRSSSLTEATRARLRQRNRIRADVLEIWPEKGVSNR